MDDCLPGSEEFERRKNMMRLMGMTHLYFYPIHTIMYEGVIFCQSSQSEDYAWEAAWFKYQLQNK